MLIGQFGKNIHEDPLNILVVTQYFWPESFRINDLVKELCGKGHTVTVVTGVPNYPGGEVFEDYKKNPKKYNKYQEAEIIRSPTVIRRKSNLRLFLNYLNFIISGSIWGAVAISKRDIDLIFVFQTSPVSVGLPAIFFSRLKGAPIVFWVLDLWPETLTAVGAVKSELTLRLVGKLVRYIYNNCTIVLGQSPKFIASISKHCDESSKIRYFPNWSEDVYGSAVTEFAPEITREENMFSILFAGNVGEAQDMPAVIRAAEKLRKHKNIRWLIVGDGRKLRWVRTEIEKRNLGDNFFLLGSYPENRMPSFYLHADALLVSLNKDPIFSMTMPGKVQSYLAAGKPILGMLDGDGSDVITIAGAGFVCAAGDSDGLADNALKLSRLAPSERREMGVSGRKYAQAEFSKAKLFDKLEDYFEEAIKIYSRMQRKR